MSVTPTQRNNYVSSFEEGDFSLFRSELRDIYSWRRYRAGIRGDGEEKARPKVADESRPKLSHDLVGLALSGGGIRSATFNLGLLQALFRKKVLLSVDYLSTVSGGGYIATCLDSLLNSETKDGSPWSDRDFPLERDSRGMEKSPVRHLRYFSNYLTAEGGLIGKYVRPLMVFCRGVILNFLFFLPYLAILALLIALILDLPFLQENHWFFDLPEFQRGLHLLHLSREELEDYIRKRDANLTQRFPQESGSMETLIGLDPFDEELKRLKSRLDQATTRLHEEWRTIWLIPGLIFSIFILLSVGGRFLYQRSFPVRHRFSNFLSLLFFMALASLALQLYGVAVAYVTESGFSGPLKFTALLALLAPKMLDRLNIPRVSPRQKRSGLRIALSIILFASVPLFLLYLIGVALHYIYQYFFGLPGYLTLSLTTLLLYLMICRFININEISLHNFYRDRLSRAYLIQNSPQASYPYEEVIHRDHLRLSQLDPQKGPYHIFNTTLNLTRKMPGRERGIFRTGESFILTRNWCGSEKTGYQATPDYERRDRHIDLGTAMAISAAAVNIGMAYKNIPVLRPLMGLLNMRLGYWAPNPMTEVPRWRRWLLGDFPASWYLIKELFGLYSLKDTHLNISDGGHFDNTGVYELLRRRCRYIIVSDAEADPDMKFEGLSYVMRLARIDFGIDIEIDIGGIVPGEEGFSSSHFAVGRIHYPGEDEPGYLIYLKASLTGDEPAHLREYKIKNPDFPHQTTADQWFDEHQFEAYRELGYHIGKGTFEYLSQLNPAGLEKAIMALCQSHR